MRSNFYENFKTLFFGFAFAPFISCIILCLLPLNGFCASSGGGSNAITQLPFQYGVGSGYGYSKSDSEIQTAIDLVLQNYQTLAGGGNEQVQWIYMLEEGSDYIKLRATRGNCYVFVNSSSSYPNLNYVSGLSYDNLNVSGTGYSFLIQNGSISLIWDNFNTSSISNFTESTPTGGIMQKSGFCYGFPLWSYGEKSIQTTGGQDLLIPFIGGGSDSFSFSGHSVGGMSGYLDPDTGDFSGDIDLDITLDFDGSGFMAGIEGIQDSLDTLNDISGTISGKIDDINEKLDEMEEVPTPSTTLGLLFNNEVFGAFQNITTGVGNLYVALTQDIEVVDGDELNFDYVFIWDSPVGVDGSNSVVNLVL